MAEGIQAIKYDCLAYLKEFGALPGGWIIALTDTPDAEIDRAWLRRGNSPWMSRAAISERAARNVAEFLCARFARAICVRPDVNAGRVIILYKLPEGGPAQ